MKQAFIAAAGAVLLGTAAVLLTVLLLRNERAAPETEAAAQGTEEADSAAQPGESSLVEALAVQPQIDPSDVAETTERRSFDKRFHLPVLQDGTLVSMELHRYLLGAVLGEMPTSFETEALRAQAIACRTFVLRRYTNRKHDPAAVCTEPGCCMCWVDPDAYAAANGEAALEKAEQAVSDTDGLALYYNGTLIDATFFSSSGGRTEDASAVWGTELPYLHAVDSPGEESPYNTDTKEIPDDSFTEILTQENEMAVFPEDRSAWIGPETRTNGGGVDTVELGGCIYTGTQLRRLFGLRSTVFSIEISEDSVVFTTHGFGHRVGLSQYGANTMAKQGCTAEEILKHYYQGVELFDAANGPS